MLLYLYSSSPCMPPTPLTPLPLVGEGGNIIIVWVVSEGTLAGSLDLRASESRVKRSFSSAERRRRSCEAPPSAIRGQPLRGCIVFFVVCRLCWRLLWSCGRLCLWSLLPEGLHHHTYIVILTT